MTTKYSPAPWTYDFNPYSLHREDDSHIAAVEIPAYEINDAEGTKIFDTNEDLPDDLQNANARLATAAPDLLAACQLVVTRWEHGDLAEAARACSDAIADATAAHPPRSGPRCYSVLLLYPDYANDSGTETYYAFVSAADPIEAVSIAQQQASAAQEGVTIDPDDFAPLLVTQGHHDSQPLFNK